MTCQLPYAGPWMTLVRHTGHSLATVLKKMPWMTCWQWKSTCITMLGSTASQRERSKEWVTLGLDLKHFPVTESLSIDIISLSINRYVWGNLCLDSCSHRLYSSFSTGWIWWPTKTESPLCAVMAPTENCQLLWLSLGIHQFCCWWEMGALLGERWADLWAGRGTLTV